MTPGALTGPAGNLLVTFLGLVAASILPTITLLLSSMSAGGRSVMKLGDLHLELRNGIRSLFYVFGWTVAAVFVLVVLALPMPRLLTMLPWIGEWITRLMQGMSMTLTTLALLKAPQIPKAIHRCLDLMAEIANDEAKSRTLENASKAGDVTTNFKTAPGFGKVHSLEDLGGSNAEPH